ncbi:NOL1/NOP2/sun family putative RNA methylase [Lachnospiraceae bacterium PFB1-21]
MIQLPAAFSAKMKRILQGEYEDYLACFDDERLYGLRVNEGKISVEEFLEICPFELRKIPWIHNGFFYDGESVSPAKHPYYHAGLYYLQEPSAMTPASRLPIEAGDKVLDLCAAPGGKATELGAGLKRTGMLVANDISNSRAKGLLKNIEVFGIGNVLVLSEEPGHLIEFFPHFFDKILIDAPCSGEGMFRKDPKMIKAWSEESPEFFAGLQRGILAQALAMLKPEGMLLYSTCTFDERENEQMIEEFLIAHPSLSLKSITPNYEGFTNGFVTLTKTEMPEIAKSVRIFPHKMAGEGHFLALLENKEESKTLTYEEATYQGKLPVEAKDFLDLLGISFDKSRLSLQKERLFYMPEGVPRLKGLRFLRSGLLLGECKKNRFEPSQALAMYLKKEEYPFVLDLSVTDERVLRYLKGETIAAPELSEKGYYLVCVDGYPLGWGKLVNRMLKNKYLPGWRMSC